MIRDGMPTSDGLYTALRVLQKSIGKKLPVTGWTRLPQTLKNVRNVKLETNCPKYRQRKTKGVGYWFVHPAPSPWSASWWKAPPVSLG